MTFTDMKYLPIFDCSMHVDVAITGAPCAITFEDNGNNATCAVHIVINDSTKKLNILKC